MGPFTNYVRLKKIFFSTSLTLMYDFVTNGL